MDVVDIVQSQKRVFVSVRVADNYVFDRPNKPAICDFFHSCMYKISETNREQFVY